MRYDVLTYFDTCVDIIANIGDAAITFEQNEVIIPSIEAVLGGSACIFASGCAKLGLNVSGPGVIGRDAFGGMVKSELAQNGVDTGLLTENPDIKTAVGISLCRGDRRTILTCDESITSLKADSLTAGALAQARHLHIASYYLLTGVRPSLAAVAKEAKRLGLTVSLDTNWDPAERWELPQELLSCVDIILPNETEVCKLTGESDIDQAAARLLARVPIVVVKRGSQGATLYHDTKRYDALPPSFPCKDTVGAGDSFDAGFIYGFLNKRPLWECLNAALYCGSMSIREAGGCAGQAVLDEVIQYLNTGGKS